MDAGGDERDHAEHDDCERVDVVADRQSQLAELAEQVIVARIRDRQSAGDRHRVLQRRPDGILSSRLRAADSALTNWIWVDCMRIGADRCSGLSGMFAVMGSILGGVMREPDAEAGKSQQARPNDGRGGDVASQCRL